MNPIKHIKNYSDLTSFKDLPIGSIFAKFNFDCETECYQCKISQEKSMDLTEHPKINKFDLYKKDDYYVIPLTDLTGETSSNPALVKMSSLKNRDLFVIPENWQEELMFFAYHKDKSSFYVLEYMENYVFEEENDGDEIYYVNKRYSADKFPEDIFVFPLKYLKIIKNKKEGKTQYFSLTQKNA